MKIDTIFTWCRGAPPFTQPTGGIDVIHWTMIDLIWKKNSSGIERGGEGVLGSQWSVMKLTSGQEGN